MLTLGYFLKCVKSFTKIIGVHSKIQALTLNFIWAACIFCLCHLCGHIAEDNVLLLLSYAKLNSQAKYYSGSVIYVNNT